MLNVHHIESRKTGGDAPNNLVTLCEACHTAYHRGEIALPDTVKRSGSFRDAAFMGIMRRALTDELKGIYPCVKTTYGYITKNLRIQCGLEKSHIADARCISGNPKAKPASEWFCQKAVRTKNRQIHKMTIGKGGVRKHNQSPKYVHGYQLYDQVKLGKTVCFVFGRRASGSFDVRRLDGTKVSAASAIRN